MNMLDVHTFVIEVRGVPIPQPRDDGRVIMRPGRKPFVQMYTPKVCEKIGERPDGKAIYGPDKLQPWRDRLRLAARDKVAEPWDGPVLVDCTFYFPRTKDLLRPSAPRGAIPMAVKPDRDNLDKAVLDALSPDPDPDAGWDGLWTNDSRVYGGALLKFYVAIGMEPGARIHVRLQQLGTVGKQLTLGDAA